MHPEGEIRAILPEVVLSSDFKLNGKSHKVNTKLETLIVEPNEKKISMVWRAAFAADKRALEVSEIEIKLAR
jgi:hypothetical protein